MKFLEAWWSRGANGETIVEMLDELAVVQRALDTKDPEGTSHLGPRVISEYVAAEVQCAWIGEKNQRSSRREGSGSCA